MYMWIIQISILRVYFWPKLFLLVYEQTKKNTIFRLFLIILNWNSVIENKTRTKLICYAKRIQKNENLIFNANNRI